jgi:hypothetical protein
VTLFEYLAIAYSLVISFAVLRAASGLPHALASGRRYWIHAAWLLTNLAGSLITFWLFWSFREVEWSLGRFVLALSNPTLIFVCASILVPDQPGRVQSWREHFYTVRLRYFAYAIAWLVVVALITTVVLDVPVRHPARLFQSAFLILFIAGAATSRPKIHAVLAVLPLLLVLAGALGFLAGPGAIAPHP